MDGTHGSREAVGEACTGGDTHLPTVAGRHIQGYTPPGYVREA